MEIRVITEKADMDQYLQRMYRFLDVEENDQCRRMIQDNIDFVSDISCRVAITHKFLMAFQYEPNGSRKAELSEICRTLDEEADKARKYLDLCGLETVIPEQADPYVLDLLKSLLRKRGSQNGSVSGLEERYDQR